ncbi:uncharacterized protein PG986_008213 [Apiospora aurea]|uniref:C2H2-type domain-containing protein n=1 Tax=Apiospora aurea TaxID=335848 RepID=A0ABR1QG70_9PEZI
MGPAPGISGSAGPVDTQMFPRTSHPRSLSEVEMSLLTSSYNTSSPVLLGAFAHPRNMPAQNALAHWYTTNDGPWIPKDLALPEDDDRSPSRIHTMNLQGHPMGFPGQYRERYVPSECETTPPGMAPSDSGYGSHAAKQSVTATSLYDEPMDRNTETQSLAGHLSEFHFPSYGHGMEYMTKNTSPGDWVMPPQQPLQQQARHFEGKGIICETCKKAVKTNSELKKHRQRHTKPFTCNVPGCGRTEGFSTPNDLDRHKRSVHPEESPVGSRFQCPHGPCKNKDKIWPRADNFRAHLKRVHRIEKVKDEDLEGSIYQPQVHPPSQAQDMLSDLAVVPEQSGGCDDFEISPSLETGQPQYWSPDENHSTEDGLHHNESAQADYSRSQLDDTNMALGHMTGGTGASNDMVEPASEDEHLGMSDPLQAIGPIQTKLSQSLRPSIQNDPERPEFEQRNSQFISPEDLRQEQRPPNSSSVSSATGTEASLSSTSYDGDEPQSPEVEAKVSTYDGSMNPTSKRESEKQGVDISTAQDPPVISVSDISSLQLELKDPEKQSSPVVETRPEDISQGGKPDNYHACTELGCDKKFQRPCELKSAEVCGKLSHRRETFKEHLSKNHSLQGEGLEMKLEHCRVGRNCEARFWCGFCERIIEIERKGLGAFTERFNHIDDHFSGREGLPKKQVDDWKDVDPDAPPVEALSSDPEDGDSAPRSQPAPLFASSRPARKGTPKEQHSHLAGPLAGPKKRKRDDGYIAVHQGKRAKAPPSTLVGVVMRCPPSVPTAEVADGLIGDRAAEKKGFSSRHGIKIVEIF